MAYGDYVLELLKEGETLTAGSVSAPILTREYQAGTLMLVGSGSLVVQVESIIAKNAAAYVPQESDWLPVRRLNGTGYFDLSPIYSLTRIRVISGTVTMARLQGYLEPLSPYISVNLYADLAARLEALEAVPGGGTSLTTTVQQNTAAIGTLSGQVGAITTSINNLGSTVNAQANRISTLENSDSLKTTAINAINASRAANAKLYGAKGDGVTDDTTALEAWLSAIPRYGAGYLPAGVYLFSRTLRLPGADRVVYGDGWASILKQANGANLADLITFAASAERDVAGYVLSCHLRDFRLDGNKAQNAGTGNGIHLTGHGYSTLENLRVENTKGSAYMWDGTSSTIHLNNCWGYGSDAYNVRTSNGVADLHIRGGDYGYANQGGIYLGSPSSSIHGATVWGTRAGSGVQIENISCQVMSCQIEGNAQHGVAVFASHAFVGNNKIYANSYTSGTNEQFDGVYVLGSVAFPLTNAVITGNDIYSSLIGGEPRQRYGVTLDANHSNCQIGNNAVRFATGNGVISSARQYVFGAKAGDIIDGQLWVDAASGYPTRLGDGDSVWRIDKLRKEYYNPQFGWVHGLRAQVDIDRQTHTINPGLTTYDVVFAQPRSNFDYTVSGSTSWLTTFGVTLKTVNGFRVTFGTAPTGTEQFGWLLMQNPN